MRIKPENVPVFKSWSVWYGLVIGFLVVIILLLSWLTQAYS
jgi:hypothetical protein